MSHVIDLRSDTLSMPTEEMLLCIQTAALGDDSRDGDPTVMELEALSAELMGKEAGLLTPSGTMSNLVAMRTHVEPGATAIVEQSAHLYGAEIGGIASACGLLVLPVPGRHGAMDLDALRFAARKVGTLFPTTGMLCLENTHNAAGGTVIAPEHIEESSAIAREHGLRVHLDGARIFNAGVVLGEDVRTITSHADSVSFCLSKGLSAPVGSLLTGPKDFIDRARMVRRALGGTLRQAGIIAAPGLVALRTGIPRLAEDHANAKKLALGLAERFPGSCDPGIVETNLFHINVAALGLSGQQIADRLRREGLLVFAGEPRMRLATHCMITAEDIDEALEAFGRLGSE